MTLICISKHLKLRIWCRWIVLTRSTRQKRENFSWRFRHIEFCQATSTTDIALVCHTFFKITFPEWSNTASKGSSFISTEFISSPEISWAWNFQIVATLKYCHLWYREGGPIFDLLKENIYDGTLFSCLTGCSQHYAIALS